MKEVKEDLARSIRALIFLILWLAVTGGLIWVVSTLTITPTWI